MAQHDAALIFDLDGTLVDNVYHHVMAWNEALRASHIELAIWRIHRRIGMSGELMVRALGREIAHELDQPTIDRLQRDHGVAYKKREREVRPLPGVKELLATLTRAGVGWAIATSSERKKAEASLALLDVPAGVPVLTRDDVDHAKPNPDLFVAAAEVLGVEPVRSFVVGDAPWDILAARRAGALGIGLLSGGYGESELVDAGAYRVYNDAAGLLAHLDELGFRV